MTQARRSLEKLSFRRAGLNEIIELRHTVLRPGLPLETAIFPGDDRPDTIHYAALDGERIIACATLHVSTWNDSPAWQLRGMAAADGYRGTGVGKRLLQGLEVEAHAAAPEIFQFWCNARMPAAGFYQRVGWTISSEIFEIPTAGPHVKMTKSLR